MATIERNPPSARLSNVCNNVTSFLKAIFFVAKCCWETYSLTAPVRRSMCGHPALHCDDSGNQLGARVRNIDRNALIRFSMSYESLL
jgi:hypothetical protein